MLLEPELERNERVRAILTAYEELAEEEKALFRLAAGISQDAPGKPTKPRQRATSEASDETLPDKVQPIVRNLMKSLLEDHPSLLNESDIDNLMDRDYTQNILGLNLAGFPLLRRREDGRRGSDNDDNSRYYAKLHAGRYYVCSQWWRDAHLANARSLLRFVEEIAGREPNHAGIPDLERHMTALRNYISRTA